MTQYVKLFIIETNYIRRQQVRKNIVIILVSIILFSSFVFYKYTQLAESQEQCLLSVNKPDLSSQDFSSQTYKKLQLYYKNISTCYFHVVIKDIINNYPLFTGIKLLRLYNSIIDDLTKLYKILYYENNFCPEKCDKIQALGIFSDIDSFQLSLLQLLNADLDDYSYNFRKSCNDAGKECSAQYSAVMLQSFLSGSALTQANDIYQSLTDKLEKFAQTANCSNDKLNITKEIWNYLIIVSIKDIKSSD